MGCKKCYWYGKCPECEPCEDYTPLDDNLGLLEYESELDERVWIYEEHINEMNA